MSYKVTNDALMILVDAATIAGDDAAINAAFPTLLPGTIIHDAGFNTMKQKGLDGSWATL